MENPLKEIEGVVKGLVRAEDATKQRECLQKYFTADAAFDHPMCAVASSKNSRDSGLLQIYQWLRIMFMDTLIEVHSTAYDEKNQRIYVDATQTLRCNISCIRALLVPKGRLVVVLTLVQGDDKKMYISRQEDLYAVQEMPGAIHSVVRQGIIMVKLIVGLLIMLYVAIFQAFGVWVPKPIAA